MEEKTLSRKAIAALEQGSKIEAIKITRMDHNMGLKEAKEFVEAFLEKNPHVNERLKESSSNGLGLLFFIIFIVLGVAYFFSRSQ